MVFKYKRPLVSLFGALVLFVGLAVSLSAPVSAATTVKCSDGTTVTIPHTCPAGSSPVTTTSNCNPSNALSGCCEAAQATNCIDKQCQTQSADCADTAMKCNNEHCDIVNNYINKAIDLGSGLVGLVVVASLIYGAIQYSASGGDPQKAANAKNRITKTVVALVAYILLFSLLQFLIPGGLFHTS